MEPVLSLVSHQFQCLQRQWSEDGPLTSRWKSRCKAPFGLNPAANPSTGSVVQKPKDSGQRLALDRGGGRGPWGRWEDSECMRLTNPAACLYVSARLHPHQVTDVYQ
ncbi:MAG: hypothetical protein KatS3mg132_460 [Limisphaera sp.]|nr:MAG: hypothetical protein KatS3mg132_460 [Limisphaera sp.]